MAIIPQKRLFQWEEIEDLGDLRRLELAITNLPDEPLMRALERRRGNGRNDYPVRPMWNSIIAGIVFGHEHIESLRRELLRNGQLRYVCGLTAVPTPRAYTTFLKRLSENIDLIDAMFNKLVEQLRELLPGFGTRLALDGKAIETHANPRKKNAPTTPDGRRDIDANFGQKKIVKQRKDGTTYEEIKKWFGYKLHLIVDADYELPVAFDVTPASHAEQPQGRKLIRQLATTQPQLLDDCQVLSGDKGYDDTALIKMLWDDYGIKPVIAIRQMWKDGEATKLVSGTRNVVYNNKGEVFCCCMKTGELSPMAFGGFEKERNILKYRCPAIYLGKTCAGRDRCPIASCVRIKLDEDRRIFTPLARSSYTWGNEYKKRTAVERVNSRLDVSFGFEHHYIRGQAKMKLRCGLALIVMLAMAAGRVKEKQTEHLRSLVKAA
jgi:transposase